MMKVRMTANVGICFLIVFSLVFYYALKTHGTEPNVLKPPGTTLQGGMTLKRLVNAKSTKERTFLYLVNTEQCLPDHLKSSKTIGSATACDCEVLVLSYKLKCNDTSLHHVEYLFDPSSTWSTGRNLLYETANARDKRFLYYIFMDDDIELEAKDKMVIANPWRVFEQSLLLYQPAIAAPTWSSFANNDSCPDVRVWCLSGIYWSRKMLGCELNTSDSTDFIPVAFWDAAFNAFHHTSVGHILPYATVYDDISWWFAQWKVIIQSEVLLRGSVVTHTSVTCVNTKHRDYPRALASNSDIRSLMEVVRKELPERFKHSSVLQEWKESGVSHRDISSTLCISSPPKIIDAS